MTSREIIQLRTRSLGEILDQAIRLYRNNFITFVGIIGVMQVPLTLLQILASYFMLGKSFSQILENSMPEEVLPQMLTGGLATIAISIASIILIQGIATAAMTRAIADNYMGEKTGIVEAYKKIGKSWVSILGAMLIAGIFGLIFTIWSIIPIVGWLTGPGILVFMSLVVNSLIAPSVVLENKRASDAFFRALSLGMKRFWWIIGYMAILMVLTYVIVSAPTTLISLLTQTNLQKSLAAGDFSNYSWQLALQQLLSLGLSLLFIPLKSTGVIMAYFDLRVRFEGFDLAVAARQAESENVQANELTTLSLENAKEEKLFTLSNLGKFAALSIIGILLFGLLMVVYMGIMLAFLPNMY